MAEIEKIAVYDARIVQDPPKYAVQKGALSVSTSSFQANAANASQLSFQVLVPSLNVFTDRKIELNASSYVYAEAVPSQIITNVPASVAPAPFVYPAGRYIAQPNDAFTYRQQDTASPAMYPPNGTSFNGGNTACVLEDNAWSGLQSTRGEIVSETASSIGTNVGTFTPTNPVVPLTSASTATAVALTNPFAKFTTAVNGTFELDYLFAGPLAAASGLTGGSITLTLQIINIAATTVYWSQQINVDVSFETATAAYAAANGTIPVTLINSAINAAGAQIAFTYTVTPAGIGGVSPTWTINFPTMTLSGFELGAISQPAFKNLYQPIGSPSDLSLSMFPVQSLATSMTVTINDCSVNVTGDVLREQLLLSQTRDSLMQRTCASKFDVYAYSRDDAIVGNGVMSAYGEARDSDIPNGASPIQWVHPQTGAAFNRFDAYQFALPSTGTLVTVPIINWRPAFIPLGSNLIGQTIPSSSLPGGTWTIAPSNADLPAPVMFRFQSTEPLCVSPFLWQDSKQMSEVGLYGITNMTVNLTLAQPGAVTGYDKGVAQITSANVGRMYMDKLSNAFGSYQYMTRQSGINALFGNMRLQPPAGSAGNQNGPWTETPRLLCTFLTPPPEITLPLVSSVPYVEFPRYSNSASASITGAGTYQVKSNTVTLSSIPDLLVVFVKPAFRGQTQSDTYIPISNVGVTFDNYANLCSNYSQEDLYACSVAGGLDMDWHQFRGYGRSKVSTLIPSSSGAEGTLFDTYTSTSPYAQLTGSPIILRMGQDIPLSSGLAPGTLGNYSVQVNITLDNSNGFFNYLGTVGGTTSNNVIVTVMGVNSGFFESVRGSSALRKTILNTNDVEAASTSSAVTSTQLVRLVGGAAGMHTSSRLTSSLGMPQFKPAVGSGEGERMRKMARHHGSMIP